MANVKRSTLGNIAEMVLYLKPFAGGFEVFGMDKLGRKVLLARHKELGACKADAAGTAQFLANFRKKAVRLEVENEETREFFAEND